MKKLFIAILILIVALLFYIQYSERQSAIRCVREWARVAPFPQDCKEFRISTTGSMFSRQFNCSFEAPKKVIVEWLKRCPGLREESAFTESKYKVEPGGGAQFAEIIMDWANNKVTINTYWS